MYLNWKDIIDICLQLSNEVKYSGDIPDMIVGIATGGLIPMVLIKNLLDVTDYNIIAVSHYIGTERIPDARMVSYGIENRVHRNVLIVDDIADTGETIKLAKDIYKDAKTLTLLKRYSCKVDIDYYKPIDHEQWVVFPWDRQYLI